jgi:O-antigen/teichoic acid export membrane protein
MRETAQHARRRDFLELRGRRLVLAAASGSVARAASNLATFLTFPLVIETLGKTGFGVYAVVTGVAGMLPFADLGVGLSLVTELAQARSQNDGRRARQLVSTAAAILLSCALVVLVLFWLFSQWVSWASVLGAGDGSAADDINRAMVIIVIFFALGLPGNLGYRILFALQETHVANCWQVATVPLVVLSILIGTWQHMSVVWFVGSAIGIPSVMSACATLWVLGLRHRELRPSTALLSRPEARALIKLGGVFAFQGLTMAVGYQTDAIVISHLLTIQDVAVYSATARVAALATTFSSVLLIGLWPAFSDALAKGDLDWTRRSLKKAEITAGLFSVAFVAGMMLLGRPVISMLTSHSLEPSNTLVLAVSAWAAVQTVHFPMAVLLNAAGVGRFQVLCGLSLR